MLVSGSARAGKQVENSVFREHKRKHVVFPVLIELPIVGHVIITDVPAKLGSEG